MLIVSRSSARTWCQSARRHLSVASTAAGLKAPPNTARSPRPRRGPPPQGKRPPWADEVHDEGSMRNRPYGPGPRQSRIDVPAEAVAYANARAGEALQWHHDYAQQDIDDTLVQSSALMSKDSDDRWWLNWEATWDEGWDWEAKWHPDHCEELVPRDDPRRPKGPLVPVAHGSYKPIAALNCAELASAMVAARADPPSELVWQSFCRRAEILAVSLTPAEIVAVVRCIAVRQAGQLKLLWKLATVVVEKLAGFRADDLVALANVYASADAVHHGLLNVTALVLADPEDDRNLTPPLAVAMLSAFARARYPLPLLIDEAKAVLRRSPDSLCEHLRPGTALRALKALSELDALETIDMALLLPIALGVRSLDELMTMVEDAPQDNARSHVGLLPSRVFAVSSWALNLPPLEDGEVQSFTRNSISNRDAVSLILRSIRVTLRDYDMSRFRLVQTADGMRCFVPRRGNLPSRHVEGDSSSADIVDINDMLSGAELLCDGDAGDLTLAGNLLAAASLDGGAKAWPVDLQTRWLRVAARGRMASITAESTGVHAFIEAVLAQPGSQLATHAVQIVPHLHVLADIGTDERHSVAALAEGIATEIKPSLFRLSLKDAQIVSDGFLRLGAALGACESNENVRNDVWLLVQAIVSSLPSKIRSERVFRKRGVDGVDSVDVMSWCSLLADRDLLVAACSSGGDASALATQEIWETLADEARRIIGMGDLDEEAAVLLDAFAAEGRTRAWASAQHDGVKSPLATVAEATMAAWYRSVACDSVDLEDPEHEPLAVAEDVSGRLGRTLRSLGLGSEVDALQRSKLTGDSAS